MWVRQMPRLELRCYACIWPIDLSKIRLMSQRLPELWRVTPQATSSFSWTKRQETLWNEGFQSQLIFLRKHGGVYRLRLRRKRSGASKPLPLGGYRVRRQ